VRRSFAISSIIHAAFLLAIIVPGYHPPRRLSTQIINVSLVKEEESKKPEAAVKKVETPKPKPQPEKKPEKPKMAYKAKTKTKTTDKETKPEPRRTEKPPETKPQPRETKPAEPKARSGSTSNIRVDEEDFRFAYYLEIIKERVSFNWSPPPVSGAGEEVMCTVYFRIMKDGTVKAVKMEKGSGFDLFDRSALRAVNLSGPLPPLPAGFGGRWLGVHFEFQQTSG
jgi:TonB family protein